MLEVTSCGVRPVRRDGKVVMHYANVTLGDCIHINGFRVHPNGRIFNPSRKGTGSLNYDVVCFAGSPAGTALRKLVHEAIRQALTTQTGCELYGD